MKSQISRWGNSLAVKIPKSITESLNLKAKDRVIFSVDEGKIVLEPIEVLEELSLDELLAEVNEPPEAEVDWGKPMGNEIW
jgi:antitoxin MazE